MTAAGRPEPNELEALIRYIRDHRKYDFSGYRRESLARRIGQRLAFLGITNGAAYIDYLERNPDELASLVDHVLINVTSFFRDPLSWSSLARQVGRILGEKPPDEPLRVWSAGCASGEEPYTIAILLAELLGEEDLARHATIHATDIDEGALAAGRAGSYPARALDAVPPEYASRYFFRDGSSFAISPSLQRAVVFERRDLVQHPPVTNVDLLVCRNTLMYFDPATQMTVIRGLHSALASHGVLLLGRAEMLLRQRGLFAPVDVKSRLFAPLGA